MVTQINKVLRLIEPAHPQRSDYLSSLRALTPAEQISLLQTLDPQVLLAAMQQQLQAKDAPIPSAQAVAANEEKRRANRRRVFFPAKIIFNGRLCVISCQIRDISETGCKLRVANTAAVPSRFTLQFSDGTSSRECEVAWRGEADLGVKFAS